MNAAASAVSRPTVDTTISAVVDAENRNDIRQIM
jgi:hypothetical protein